MPPDIQTVVIKSWEHALNVLYAESWRPDIKRFKSSFVFRGLDSSDYKLVTTLQRLAKNDPNWIPRLEKHLLRNFKKYAHRDVVSKDTVWHWLAIAQHHGLATRLLDWTYSPLVALHFATANMQYIQADGLIWMVDIYQVQQEMPLSLRTQLQDVGSASFDIEMLSSSKLDPWKLMTYPDQLSKDGFLIFFEPPSMDDRIINQFGLFSILSDPQASSEEWFLNRPHLCRKIIIPGDKKWEIRDKLDQANITERVLFPGLDGLSDWLNRNYFSR
ncbi:MAG: FRG domain-containing protein [Anaerolineales bacterium]